jgi:hypothetical protein
LPQDGKSFVALGAADGGASAWQRSVVPGVILELRHDLKARALQHSPALVVSVRYTREDVGRGEGCLGVASNCLDRRGGQPSSTSRLGQPVAQPVLRRIYWHQSNTADEFFHFVDAEGKCWPLLLELRHILGRPSILSL